MSAAPAVKAVKATKVPPSSFSSLLRRSKFVTYDPKIGQIYTTYDGSAHRGDWGIKRPLAARRRDARRAIHTIDTAYQQTEWTSAYTDTQWIRKFQELGITPTLNRKGNWARRFGVQSQNLLHDSDFTDHTINPADAYYLERTLPSPNLLVMTEKRFDRYLRKRAEQKHGYSVASLNPSPAKPPYYMKAKLEFSPEHQTFLKKKLADEFKVPNSTAIRPLPHPAAGLTYALNTELKTALTSKPVPGRVLHTLPHMEKTPIYSVNVAVAGWLGSEDVLKDDAVKTTDWGTMEGDPRSDAEAGKGMYRPVECAITKPPEVVGKEPQLLQATNLEMNFMRWDDVERVRQNPHRPGTAEYVTHQELDTLTAKTKRTVLKTLSPTLPYNSKQPSMTNPVSSSRKETKVVNQGSILLDSLRRLTPVVSDEDLD